MVHDSLANNKTVKTDRIRFGQITIIPIQISNLTTYLL